MGSVVASVRVDWRVDEGRIDGKNMEKPLRANWSRRSYNRRKREGTLSKPRENTLHSLGFSMVLTNYEMTF